MSQHPPRQYAKEALLEVYNQLQKLSHLDVPQGVQIPPPLKTAKPKEAANELGSTESVDERTPQSWLWIASKGPPYEVFTEETVQMKLECGEIGLEDSLVPMSAIENLGVSARDLMDLFEKQKMTKRDNLRQRAKESARCAENLPTWKFVEEDGLTARSQHLGWDQVFYLDPKDQLQGPFGQAQMCHWWKNGHLPTWLRVRPPTTDRFCNIKVLIAKWASTEDAWQLEGSSSDGQTISKQYLIEGFLSGDINPDQCVLPISFGTAREWLPLLFLMVHWLPFSSGWFIKEAPDLVESMEVRDAFDLWKDIYGLQSGILTVRPESWNCNCYIPIESLMESYGFLE